MIRGLLAPMVCALLFATGLSAEIPSQYAVLYGDLDAELSAAERYLDRGPQRPRGDCVPMSELANASSFRGEALLQPGTKASVALELDRLQELNLRGVNVMLCYPMLDSRSNPPFPRCEEYQEFYTWVAQEVHRRGMKLQIEMNSFYHGPLQWVNGVQWDYHLTLDQYAAGLARQSEWTIRAMRPEFLTVLDEPDTLQQNTGLPLSPENVVKVVNTVLRSIDRGRVRVAAGAGTWSRMEYFERLAHETSVDAIDAHVYSILGDNLTTKMEAVHRLCVATGKRLACGECWLDKYTEAELDRRLTQSVWMSRNAWSFFEPLDARFIAIMTRESRLYDMEFCSTFWSEYYFGDVAYGPATANLSPQDLLGLAKRSATRNMQEDRFTALGVALAVIVQR